MTDNDTNQSLNLLEFLDDWRFLVFFLGLQAQSKLTCPSGPDGLDFGSVTSSELTD